MIDDFLPERLFTEPPKQMDFETTFDNLLLFVENVFRKGQYKKKALELYLRAPLIVSAVINGQIKGTVKKETTILQSFQLLRHVYLGNKEEVLESIGYLERVMPSDFPIESRQDRLSWQGSNPALLRLLKDKMDGAKYHPEALVGSAHGAIRPGVLLALMLEIPPYFIRYSKFKTEDAQPQITTIDQVNLEKRCSGRLVLCYDEDAPTGQTLEMLRSVIKPYCLSAETASSLAYRGNLKLPSPKQIREEGLVRMVHDENHKEHEIPFPKTFLPDFVGDYFD